MATHPGWIACPVDTLVWVVLLRVDPTVVNDELEGVVHEAPVATCIVGPVAVHKLLLRERDQLAGDNLIDALNSCDRRERPAASWYTSRAVDNYIIVIDANLYYIYCKATL